jgi:hypothetical protein
LPFHYNLEKLIFRKRRSALNAKSVSRPLLRREDGLSRSILECGCPLSESERLVVIEGSLEAPRRLIPHNPQLIAHLEAFRIDPNQVFGLRIIIRMVRSLYVSQPTFCFNDLKIGFSLSTKEIFHKKNKK